ncbi:hypothetical protein DFP94_10717 [Fontibacillus phaseoli]|uniref:Uncharacterized protein n=1 Tax=Fontibacillus phaseoli TaxID=1416533 RepID=A0A369BEG6_9BACL|nr:hypothetical protein [Fontibacillus phaseoli]RCX18064.1 hypothetical protein DFP94_10717 [Fontibacillus phaseoli]
MQLLHSFDFDFTVTPSYSYHSGDLRAFSALPGWKCFLYGIIT